MRQRGMALLVLLYGLVLGSMSFLLATLNHTIQLDLQPQRSAEVMAGVKRALLGRAATDTSLPGSLPCPDANGDGSADLLSGNDCPYYLGRVPYKTLGIAEPLDGAGEPLWYALSRNFRDDDSNSINSDTVGDLSLSGLQNDPALAALLFAPGIPLPGQSHADTNAASCPSTGNTQNETLCAANYLEGSNATLNSKASRNLSFQSLASTANFNDQVLPIRSKEILALTGTRIAREVKSCLDRYAAVSSARYPWAAKITDTAQFHATVSRYYGRLPAQPRPLTAEVSDASVSALLDALAALQFALDRHAANNTIANRSALQAAGLLVVGSAYSISNHQPPALSVNLTQSANNAGVAAQALAQTPPASTLTQVRGHLQATLSGLSAEGVPLDSGMSISWPASCAHVGSSYWAHWRNEVFYQVADGAQPGGSSCIVNTGCLHLNGSGNYPAMVLVAGPPLAGQTPRQPTAEPPSTWLEGANLHSSPAIDFETHRSIEPAFEQINDRVVCVDGRNACR